MEPLGNLPIKFCQTAEADSLRRPLPLGIASLALLALMLLTGSSCSVPESNAVRLTVGCSLPEPAREALRRELQILARELEVDTVHVRSLPEKNLRDHLLRRSIGTAEEGFDLVIVPNHLLGQFDGRGILAEVPLALSDRLAAVMLPSAWEAVSDGTRNIAIPLGSEVAAMVYNPAFFPQPPASLAETARVSRRNPGTAPISLDLEDPLILAGYLIADAGPAAAGASGRLFFSRQRIPRLLDAFIALHDPDGDPWWLYRGLPLESIQVQLFAEGRLLTLLARPRLLTALEGFAVPFEVAPVPPLEPDGPPIRQLVSYQCIIVTADSPWVDLAFALADRLTSEPILERLNSATRHLPVIAASYRTGSPAKSRAMLGFLRVMEQGVTFPLFARWDEDYHELAELLEEEARAQFDPRRARHRGGGTS